VTPDDYAAGFIADLKISDADDPRQQQTDKRILGASDIGHCREYARRFLEGEPFTDTPEGSQARAGRAFHALVLPAVASQRPGALVEQEVRVLLPNGVEVLGHVDLVEPDEPSVTDLKTVDADLAAVRRTGASEQQKMQRQLYAAGAVQAGLVPADGLIVRNIWMDRSGTPTPPHVEQEPYDPQYLDRAASWIEEVMHHVQAGTEAPRDKDLYWCRAFCPFAAACRGPQEDAAEETVSEEYAAAAALYLEGAVMEREGRDLKRAAASRLAPLEGHKTVVVGEDGARHRVASTWVGPAQIKPGLRSGYFRLNVQEVQ